MSALGLTGCNTESGGSNSPSIQTEPFFCAGGVCSLARGVALNEEYATLVQDELALGNVILKAANGSKLKLAHSIEWNSAHSLTLQAENDMELFGGITASQGRLIIDNPGHSYEVRRPIHLSAGDHFRVNGEDYRVITSLGSQGSSTGTDLQGIIANLDGNYALGSNIDASDTENWSNGFVPLSVIDFSAEEPIPFSGNFDGLGHVISNLTVGSDSPFPAGLFGILENSTIRNLALQNADIRPSYNSSGAFAGLVFNNARIINSCLISSDVGSIAEVGGFIGAFDGSITITDSCYLAGDLFSVDDNAGGLIGRPGQGSIDSPSQINRSYIFYTTMSADGSQDAFVTSTAKATILNSFFDPTALSTTHSGATSITRATMNQIERYENAGWNISTEPEGDSRWYLNTQTGQVLPPMLRLFQSIDLTAVLPED